MSLFALNYALKVQAFVKFSTIKNRQKVIKNSKGMFKVCRKKNTVAYGKIDII